MEPFLEKAKTASFVLPKDLIKDIEKTATDMAMSKSAVVRQALELGLKQLRTTKGKKRG